MRIQYGTNKGKNYTEEEDRFLVNIEKVFIFLSFLTDSEIIKSVPTVFSVISLAFCIDSELLNFVV